jgi:hypothetical protein
LLSILSLSDLDIGVKPAPKRKLSVKESEHELFDICSGQLSDVSEMANIIKDWTHRHQELMDERL